MIKKLASSIREFKKQTILTPIMIAMEVVMEVIIPIIMARLIDDGINKGNMTQVIICGVVLALLCIASLVFGVLGGKFAAEGMAGFGRNLRHDMFHRVQTFSFANIDKFSTSSIITRLTTDITSVQNAYSMLLRMAVRGPMTAVIATIMAFTLNWKLSLIFVAIIPVLVGGLLFISSHVHPVFGRMFKEMDRMNRVVQENLHGIRVVKSFVRKDFEDEKFDEASGSVYKLNLKAERMLALNSPFMQCCMYVCTLLVSYLGAKMIIGSMGEAMTTGELTALIAYATQILGSLMMLGMVYVMLTMARAAGERIIEIMDEETDIANPANPVTEVKDGSVDFIGASFSYSKDPNNCCLSDINIHIESGETVGILGGTGSSKTSLVQLIPRLYDTTGGTVKVGGVDVKDYDIPTLRDSVAMVLQKNELFAGTIYQNLRWGNENATNEEVEHAAKLAQADDFIRSFPEGYETFIEQGGTNVSGGQKQRLCIARAILKKPRILILDDSTSAVDTRTDALIRKAFMDEIPNTTKFIIAQRVASVEDADKIIVLDGGRVNGFGTHEELLATNEIYREVYETQKKGGSDDE